MSDVAKHAPLPWFLEGNFDATSHEPIGGWISRHINGKNGAETPLFEVSAIVGDKCEICANAALIVQSVNERPALIEENKALREVLIQCERFIAHEYRDERHVEAGEWLDPEAREIYAAIATALSLNSREPDDET